MISIIDPTDLDPMQDYQRRPIKSQYFVMDNAGENVYVEVKILVDGPRLGQDLRIQMAN